MNRYLLLGGGDLAREIRAVVLDAAGEGDRCQFAAFDDDVNAVAPVFEAKCHTVAEACDRFPVATWRAICCTGSTKSRSSLYQRFHDAGYQFATICHCDTTNLADGLGEGCVVFPGARLAIGCRLGKNVVVNFGATIGHDTIIGDHSTVAPGAQIGGRVVGGQGVVYGIGCSVLQGRRIGDHAVVAAGSSVLVDVPAGVTVMGVPAAVRHIPGRKG